MSELPTTVTVLTPRGRGAVATVSVEGPLAVSLVERRFIAAAGGSLSELPLHRIAFGRWMTGAEPGEELVVCRLREDQVEVHCHGGTAAVEAIVASLESAGGVRRSSEDWAGSHSSDLIQAETQLALAEAKTERTALILLDQHHGALRREVEAIIDVLEHCGATEASSRLAILSQRMTIGLHLTAPWRVAIVGPPNVGKSSLMNAMVGYSRSIVFDQPGTTRDLVTADTAFDGWPVQLIDTAGLREAENAVEAAGIDLATQAGQAADLQLLVVDATTAASQLTAAANSMTVLNKMDLCPERTQHPGIKVSAKTGEGVEDLMKEIVRTLVGTPPAQGDAVPFNPRHALLLAQSEEQIAAGLLSEAVVSLKTVLRGLAETR